MSQLTRASKIHQQWNDHQHRVPAPHGHGNTGSAQQGQQLPNNQQVQQLADFCVRFF